jgi:hypothetical protein
MVYLLLDVTLMRKEKPNVEHAFAWKNPWFEENDSDGFASELLWDVFDHEVLEDEDGPKPDHSGYRPSFPYRVRRLEQEVRYPHDGDPQGRIRCEGWVICSVDTTGFCEELRTAAHV